MNFELFIARRITGRQKGSLSLPFINIAVISIALGICTMLVSLAILTGFQKEIKDKVSGFSSHIQINNLDQNTSYETSPVEKNPVLVNEIKKNKNIDHIQSYAIKAGIIKTKEQIQGILIKGIGSDFDWSYMKTQLKEGTIFNVSDTGKTNKIIISKHLALKLKLKLYDDIIVYFIEDPPRVRKFNICGLYQTGMEEFDNLYILADISHIQKLNNWTQNQITGYEIFIKDFSMLEQTTGFINLNSPYNIKTNNIKKIYPEIFDWLELMDMNVFIIIIIMLLVTSITMVSTLLVLILEKTRMIGILTALGTRFGSLRNIFLYNAVHIIIKGLIIGNFIAISLCYLQSHYKIIKLPQESYYIDAVPIFINTWHFIALNLFTLVICTLILLIPSYIISRLSPVKAIRYN
ncbi:MAG: ABC transporter permease [Bacteroidales bacterium]|nr:ABC transporter permease [Bacteroidales bacterium]